MTRLLLIDDDTFVQEYVRRLLLDRAYELHCAATAASGLAACQRQLPDLVLMDLGLPDDEGFELCARLRALDALLPILIVSARHRVLDRVAGLQAGADDFIQKPFERVELLARIEAQLRRQSAYRQALASQLPQCPLRVAGLELDPDARTAHFGAQALRLSKTEFRLLETFCRQADKVLERDYLLSEVWQTRVGSTRTVDNFVMRLRRKLAEAVGAVGADLPVLETAYGFGYRLRTRSEASRATPIDISCDSDYAQT